MAELLDRNRINLSCLWKQASVKLKASTLIETLVASVIIVIIFSIASLTLNTIFKNSIHGNTEAIETHINKLMYLYQHHKIDSKYHEDFNNWEIDFSQRIDQSMTYILIEATNIKTNKKITKKMIDEKAD